MKKSLSLGALLITGGLIALLIQFIVTGGSFSTNFIPWSSTSIAMEESVDSSSIGKIKVNTASSDVKIVPANTDEITISLDGKASSNSAKAIDLKVETAGDTLELGVERKNNIGFSLFQFERITLTVALPEKIWDNVEIDVGSGNIDIPQLAGTSVTFSTGSGKITAAGIEAENAYLKTGSGNLKLTDSNATTLSVRAGSGGIHLADIQADALEADVGSGSIKAERYYSGELSFQANSGKVTLTDGEGAVTGSTGSGDITLSAKELRHDTDLKVGSGRIRVTLDSKPDSLEVDYKGNSGSGKIDWDGFNYTTNERNRISGSFGSGDVKLTARSGSGSFTLSQR